MALTAALVEATPDRLRYLLTQDGVVTSPTNPDVDGLVVIGNDGSPTPDLLTDIQSAAGGSVSGLPLKTPIDAGRNGVAAVAAGALTQAGARAVLLSDDAANILGNDLTPRAVCEVTSREDAVVQFAVDANVDGSANPVLEVRSSVGNAGTGYLDVHLRHTLDL